MGKIILDEDDLRESMEEVLGAMFYNDSGELIPPFDHLAEYFVIEMAEELMEDLTEKIKSISEVQYDS